MTVYDMFYDFILEGNEKNTNTNTFKVMNIFVIHPNLYTLV